MTIIIKLNEEKSLLINLKKYKKENKIKIDSFSYITTNYSLFKYLLKILELNSISTNENGYVVLRKQDRTKTSLQRIIMEFYSQYDKELEKKLEMLEVDHINNIKEDNETSNFQLLTRMDNMYKRHNNWFQVTIKNEHILNIDKRIKELPEYKTDERYFKIKNGKFRNMLKNNTINNVLDCVYLDISSTTIPKELLEPKNIYLLINRVIFRYIKDLTVKDDYFIDNLLKLKDKYIVSRILKHNLSLLNRFRNRYNYLNEVIKRFNILNSKKEEELFIEDLEEKDFNYLFKTLGKSKDVLFDLYKTIIDNDLYTIEDDNILLTLEIGFNFDEKGKYSIFRFMYLLGLLNRHNSSNRMSFISIPFYTEELLKEANHRAKKIQDLKLRKLRYFIVREEFGEETSKRVYGERSKRLESLYLKYSIKVKEAVIEFFREDEQIKKLGYTTVDDLLEYLIYLKEQGLLEIPVYRNFISFIKDLLMYNTEVINEMKKKGFEYRIVSKDIINNIVKYQKEQGINKTIIFGLYPKEKAIVLAG